MTALQFGIALLVNSANDSNFRSFLVNQANHVRHFHDGFPAAIAGIKPSVLWMHGIVAHENRARQARGNGSPAFGKRATG